MKNKVLSILLVLSMSIVHIPVFAQSDLPSEGDKISGFTVTSAKKYESFNSDLIIFEHDKTGAEVLYCANDDINRAFGIAFKTPAINNSGIPHIVEHTTLMGSEKYPSDTLWMKLSNQSYNTFMNALTAQNTTVYPISSLSEEQLYKLSDYYLDSVFNPMIYTDDSFFDREAWHYELEDEDAPLVVDGTVYNEMLGTKTIESESLYNFRKTMYPESYSVNNSGGEPYDIPDITNDDLIEYHKAYYKPSNSLSMLYGDVDYEKFLSLLDSYFAEYGNEEVKINFKDHTATDSISDAQFDYPVLSDGDGNEKDVIIYGIECDKNSAEEIAQIYIVLNICTRHINSALMEEIPGASAGYMIDFESAKPSILFVADGVDSSNAKKFRTIVNNELTAFSKKGASPQTISSVVESIKRSEATKFEGENVGTTILTEAAVLWSTFDDAGFYFDYVNSIISQADKLSVLDMMKIMKREILPSKSAFVITVPKAGLADEIKAEIEQSMKQKKNSMSAEQIKQIVDDTQKYNNYIGDKNTELDKKLIEEISIVDVDSLSAEIKEYEITDNTYDGVRYISSVADIEKMGRGKIMIDVSDIPVEDLQWLSLYSLLISNVDSEKYTKEEISSMIDIYANCGIDITTVDADNENGFIPYLIFKYNGFSDKSERVYSIAKEILFHSDFSDMEYIRSIIASYVTAIASNIRNNGYAFLMNKVLGTTDAECAYMDTLQGIGMYDFMKSLGNMSDEEITSKLNYIKEKITNKNGACVAYAGSQESIDENTDEAKKFFLELDDTQRTPVSYGLLKSEYNNKALVIDSSVNYNGIYAPISVLDTEISGSNDVIMKYLQDRFFIPIFRDGYNAYGIDNAFSNEGLLLMTYRDPEMANTYTIYSELSEKIANGSITQEELNKYILTVYSFHIMPHGELTDAYWSADEYMNGITYENKIRTLSDIKNTVADYVNEYENIFDNLWENGILFTTGGIEAISENAHMFDEIINPLGYKLNYITINVNDKKLRTDTAAYIKNDRVMVPMRNIFEATDAEVSWNGETREVTAVKDDITIVMTIDSNIIRTNNNGEMAELIIDCPVEITNDYTMIPLRAISETLGYDVGWDGETKTVSVN